MPTNHHIQQHLDLHKIELREIYASNAIRAFSLSLIAIFVPLYLLGIGYTLTEVLWFYGLISFFHAIFTIPAALLARHIGFKHLIIASMPFFIGWYVLLITASEYHWPVWWIALFVGIKGSMFWLGYHVHFSRYTKSASKDLGTARIATTVAAALAPAIGGFILSYTTFDSLIIISLALLSISSIPFIITRDEKISFTISAKNLWRSAWPGLFGLCAKGADNAIGGVIWPTYLYLVVVSDFQTLGIIHSLMIVSGILFTYFIGKSASKNPRRILWISGITNAFVWAGRLFVKTPFGAFLTDGVYGITQSGVYIPFTALSYRRPDGVNVVERIIMREITTNVGRVVIFTLAATVFSLYGTLYLGIAVSLLLLTM